MKLLVLLALIGLVSCQTVFLQGDQHRDVKIKYSFDYDDDDRDIEVEYSRPSFKRVMVPVVSAPVRFAPQAEVRSRIVRVEEPKPVFAQVVQKPVQRTQVVQVPVPTVSVPVVTQYAKSEPEIRTVFSQSAGVPLVQIPRTKTVTQYVKSAPKIKNVLVQSQDVPVVPVSKQYVQARPVAARTTYTAPQPVVARTTFAAPQPVLARTTFSATKPVVARTTYVAPEPVVAHATYAAPQRGVPVSPMQITHSRPSFNTYSRDDSGEE